MTDGVDRTSGELSIALELASIGIVSILIADLVLRSSSGAILSVDDSAEDPSVSDSVEILVSEDETSWIFSHVEDGSCSTEFASHIEVISGGVSGVVGSGDTGVISRGVSGVFGFIKKKVEYWV